MPEDRAAVEIWQIEQAHKCPTCQTFDWEWEESATAWEPGIHWCLGCKGVEELRDQTVKDAMHPEGYKIRLYRDSRDNES